MIEEQQYVQRLHLVKARFGCHFLQFLALLASLICCACDFFFCTFVCGREDKWELYDTLYST